MNEKLAVRNFDDAALYGWCGISLDSANLFRQPVCVRCYELLIRANLSNEEIFGNVEDKKEGKKEIIHPLMNNRNKG